MADDKDKRRSTEKSSSGGSGGSGRSRSSGQTRSGGSSRRSGSSSARDAQRRTQETAKVVGDGAGKAYDSIADCFGGEKELNRTIKRYNPAFYEFAETSFLSNLSLTNRPSKFLLFLIAIALLQSFVPIFQWPLDIVARFLGFSFLYHGGVKELQDGFESSRRSAKVKSYLTVFLLSSAIQLIPNFLFDTYYHFGALWSFFLPVLLFITPWKEEPDSTIASMVADTFFQSMSTILESLIPDSMQGEHAQNMAILAAAVVGLLFWIGYLGSTAAYVIVWCYLAFETITALGRRFIKKDESSSRFYKQMTIWHDLLAIWLWRYLISAIESISVPGLISVVGLIQYYLPSYCLWMTIFFFAMLMTKKVESRHRADTWYAKWLLRGFTPAKSSSSSGSSSSTGSGQRSSSGQSSRSRESSGTSRSSSDPKKNKKK